MTQFTELQRDLLVGTLLGDANLQRFSEKGHWRYRVIHKLEHKEYVDHKFNILQEFCSSDPYSNDAPDKRTKKTYERTAFNTLTNPVFTDYAKLFYRTVEDSAEFNDLSVKSLEESVKVDEKPVRSDKKLRQVIKVVPENIEQLLTARAVAYWYMDDGALKQLGKSNGMRICTESFTDDDVKRLQKALKNRHNIETSVTEKNRIVNGQKVYVGLRIGINEKESTAFRELIKPYLVNCMKYKVSDGKRGHL
jgi:hypothetical protein